MPEPYVNTQPGDLITANLFNGLQSTIRQDIADQVKKAIDALKTVDNSGDSAKLGGKTPKELEDEIIQKALAEIPKRTGYRMLFRLLRTGRETVIEHKLKACPLVDLYQLDYFPVICATGDSKDDRRDAYVNFYLYHSSENKFTSLADVTPKPSFEIESTDSQRHAYRIRFSELLDLYHVAYTDTSTLEEIETEFWKVFFDPNEEFDEDQYCHSPWFEKCCGEQRSVAALKARGNWDDILFQMRPRKVAHFPKIPTDAPLANPVTIPTAQADVQVVHFDFNSIGLRLLSDPVYPSAPTPPTGQAKDASLDILPHLTDNAKKQLKVMVLLKV